MSDADKAARVTLAEALSRIPASGVKSAEAFRHGSLLVKVYAPRGHDPQFPHKQDEVYVVMTGRGRFVADGVSRDFGPALTDFARARLAENPGAQLLLLAFGEYGDKLTAPYRQAADTLTAEGFATDLVILPKLERTACLWHPSLADHALIAETLTASIRKDLPGWGN